MMKRKRERGKERERERSRYDVTSLQFAVFTHFNVSKTSLETNLVVARIKCDFMTFLFFDDFVVSSPS